MNVLLLAPHSFYIERGSPMAVDLLLRSLSRRGEQVDAVVYADGEDRSYPNVTLHRPRLPGWLRQIGPGFSLRKVAADLYLWALAGRLARTKRYDLVHANEEAVFIAMWLKRRRGLPYVYDMDSSIAQQLVEKLRWLTPLSWLFDWCETRAIRGAAAVVPVCNALSDLARRRGAEHVLTMYDISTLGACESRPPTDLRTDLGIGSAPILMYVGNLEKYQGIDLLIDAYAIAAKRGAAAHLVIAGGSDELIADYRHKVTAMGFSDRVHFVGRWPAARLGELLAEADILSSPRIRGLNTPMKVFPYLHSGKALLVTDLPTHNQVLTRDVAWLAKPEPEAFADAILRLSNDRELRERLGGAGRQFVERNHTLEAHERRVDELYDRISQQLAAARGR